MPTYYAPGRRKGNETWIVRGYINGKQYEIATDARNKKQAEAAWQDFAADTRREQRDAVRDRETATFDWACDEYLASRPSLNNQYKKHIGLLRSHFAGWFLKDMTPEDIYAAAYKLKPGLKPQTQQQQIVGPAATVMHYMARRRMCDHIIIPKLKPIGVRRPIAYPEQLEPLIVAATGELKVLLMTLQIHGWRISETIRIREDKIDWDNAQIERWVGKSQEWRRAPVDHEILKAWRTLPKRDDGYLFHYKHRTQVYDVLKRLKKRLGLKMPYTPHMSRRGFATALRDLGYGNDDIRDAAQWADSQSVETYVRDDPERVRPVFEELRGRIRGKLKKVK